MDNYILKTGLNYISGEHELFGGGNTNGNYTVKLTQQQMDAIKKSGVGSGLDINDIPADAIVTNYNVELRPTSFGTHQDIYSVYIEDLWSVTDRLNITLGLRYD